MAEAFTDDDVLDWWEKLDAGVSVTAIARDAGFPATTVRAELRDLGVLPPPARRDGRPSDGSPLGMYGQWALDELLERIESGTLLEDEQKIADALAKLAPDFDDAHARGSVGFARSMQHVKPGARGPVVQSERQRRNEAVGLSWRTRIRYDLFRAGLLRRP